MTIHAARGIDKTYSSASIIGPGRQFFIRPMHSGIDPVHRPIYAFSG
jgi:hypothetical protein